MYTKLSPIGLLMFCLPFLYSCEGNTDLHWILVNESFDVIEVEYGRTFEGDTVQSVVDINTTIVLSSTSRLGGDPDLNLPSTAFNYFLVVNEDGDTLQKDLMDPNQWQTDIEEQNRIPANFLHTYRMVITDSDF